MIGTLEDKFHQLREKQKQFLKEVEEVEPFVLEHFNNYIRDKINPALPNGNSLPYSTTCFLEQGGFKIHTSSFLKTPHGNFNGPVEYERIIMDLVKEYEKKTPWVSWVGLCFHLSK